MNNVNQLRTYSPAGMLKLVGGKLTGALNSKSANALSMGLGIAGGAAGLMGSMKGLSDKQQFSVVYNTPNGPKHKSVKAKSPMDAISSVKSSVGNISQARAFRLPDQDDQSQQYFESLNNKTMSCVMNIYFDTETRQFSTREERAEKRKGKKLASSSRGLGRAYLIGQGGGLIGMIGSDSYAQELYKKGYTEDEIKEKVSKRAAKRGAIGGAGLGLIGLANKNVPVTSKLIGVAAQSGASALGSYAGARKNVRSRFDKDRLVDED